MKRTKVNSSRIDSVGYDEGSKVLEVCFLNGAVYCYSGVPAEIARGLLGAKSPGRYFGQYIQNVFVGEKAPALKGEDPCPGCEHLLLEHYNDVTGVVRCLHVDSGVSSSGIIGLPYSSRCDCAGGVSKSAEEKRNKAQEQAAGLSERVAEHVNSILSDPNPKSRLQ